MHIARNTFLQEIKKINQKIVRRLSGKTSACENFTNLDIIMECGKSCLPIKSDLKPQIYQKFLSIGNLYYSIQIWDSGKVFIHIQFFLLFEFKYCIMIIHIWLSFIHIAWQIKFSVHQILYNKWTNQIFTRCIDCRYGILRICVILCPKYILTNLTSSV